MNRSQRIDGPVFQLRDIQDLLQSDPNFGLAVEQGQKAIMQQRRCTMLEARSFARKAVLSLEPSHYSESIEYQYGTKVDVYGKILEAQGWYIKVSIESDARRAYVHSCHLAMHPIETLGGTVPRAHRW